MYNKLFVPLQNTDQVVYFSVIIYSHCHGTMDDYNANSADLRFDIGIDGALAKQAGGFIDIKTLYEAILKKTGGLPPQQYANENY